MDSRVRRIVMFCTILTVGLLLLFIDVTFIQLILLMIFMAIVLPFLLGMVTVAEVREAWGNFKNQRLKNIGFLKKLDSIKLFEGKGAKKAGTPPAKKGSVVGPSAGKPAEKPARKMPFAAQIGGLVGTFRALGTSIRSRSKKDKKVEDIDRMLDSAVSGKVEASAVPSGKTATDTSLPAPPGGAGTADDDEALLSLSADEFDASLLDGLDDDGMAIPAPGEGFPADEAGGPLDMPILEPEAGEPSPDDESAELDAAASAILQANDADGDSLDEFSGLEGGGGSDADFGDLDSISLDDVELDADFGDEGESEGGIAAEAEPAAEPAAPSASAPAATGPEPVKTAWIPSDAPGDASLMEDQIGMESDMASFASTSSGTDEDLLSSLASEVKTKKKEMDLSLVRELKDFRAPADQIEKELTELHQRLGAIKKPKDTSDAQSNEIT